MKLFVVWVARHGHFSPYLNEDGENSMVTYKKYENPTQKIIRPLTFGQKFINAIIFVLEIYSEPTYSDLRLNFLGPVVQSTI